MKNRACELVVPPNAPILRLAEGACCLAFGCCEVAVEDGFLCSRHTASKEEIAYCPGCRAVLRCEKGVCLRCGGEI